MTTVALPISVSHHLVLSQPTYCSIASCDCVKSLGLYFLCHKDNERKSESSCLRQYQGERAQWCLGDSVVIGTKQIKCQPFKRWLGSRGSGQANSFEKQSTAISFSSSAAVEAFLTLMDILGNSLVAPERSGVILPLEIYKVLHVRRLIL